MNSIKKLTRGASVRLSSLSPRQIRFDISRKDWIDFGIMLVVSFLILIYKLNKA